jgi:hypothetical protein
MGGFGGVFRVLLGELADDEAKVGGDPPQSAFGWNHGVSPYSNILLGDCGNGQNAVRPVRRPATLLMVVSPVAIFV